MCCSKTLANFQREASQAAAPALPTHSCWPLPGVQGACMAQGAVVPRQGHACLEAILARLHGQEAAGQLKAVNGYVFPVRHEDLHVRQCPQNSGTLTRAGQTATPALGVAVANVYMQRHRCAVRGWAHVCACGGFNGRHQNLPIWPLGVPACRTCSFELHISAGQGAAERCSPL